MYRAIPGGSDTVSGLGKLAGEAEGVKIILHGSHLSTLLCAMSDINIKMPFNQLSCAKPDPDLPYIRCTIPHIFRRL